MPSCHATYTSGTPTPRRASPLALRPLPSPPTQVGFTREGRLQALDLQLYCNAGFSLDLRCGWANTGVVKLRISFWGVQEQVCANVPVVCIAPAHSLPLAPSPRRPCSAGVMDRALMHCDCTYRWGSLRAKGFVCKTNQASHTAFRGYGGPQVGPALHIVHCAGLFSGAGGVHATGPAVWRWRRGRWLARVDARFAPAVRRAALPRPRVVSPSRCARFLSMFSRLVGASYQHRAWWWRSRSSTASPTRWASLWRKSRH